MRIVVFIMRGFFEWTHDINLKVKWTVRPRLLGLYDRIDTSSAVFQASKDWRLECFLWHHDVGDVMLATKLLATLLVVVRHHCENDEVLMKYIEIFHQYQNRHQNQFVTNTIIRHRHKCGLVFRKNCFHKWISFDIRIDIIFSNKKEYECYGYMKWEENII